MSEATLLVNLNNYSFEQLNRLIARAKREITSRQRSQVEDVANRLYELAASIGMTPHQVLGLEPVGNSDSKSVRFCNPADPQQTWSGRGKRPRWLKDALAAGARLDDFKVQL